MTESVVLRRVPIRKILVPIFGSNYLESVEHAVRIARFYEAQLSTLYVHDISSRLSLNPSLESTLENIPPSITGQSPLIKIETKAISLRDSGPAIVKTALEGRFDLIMMGMKPRKIGFITTLGSTVRYVLKRAPCQVWIMKTL